MKHIENLMPSCQHQTGLIASTEEIFNNDNLTNQIIYDLESLKTQIKTKYKEHLRQLNNPTQNKNFCFNFIKQFIVLIFAILQQFWIEIVPQYFRGRYFAQKSSKIMDRFSKLNCGNMSLFLTRMKKQSKYFFIILEQRISNEQCFDIQQNLFDDSQESNKKLSYILQCQTMSLDSLDLNKLQKSQDSPIKLSNFIKFDTKFPLLLVCRYNFLQELKLMEYIELSFLSKQSFIQKFDEIKKNIFEMKNLQSECKRQVLMQILHNSRQNQQSNIVQFSH